MASRTRLALIAVIVIALAIAAVTIARREEPPIFPNGVWRVGVDPGLPPLAFFADGQPVGMEIEIARAIAGRLGVSIRFHPLGYDGLYDALVADQVDSVIAGLRIDAGRGGQAIYTRPYLNAGLVLVTADRAIESMGDLPGRRLALGLGSAADAEARRWLRRVWPFAIQRYETAQIAVDAVRMGEADAALVDGLSARGYRAQHPTWQVNALVVTDDLYAIALHADRGRMREAIDGALAALQADGTIDAILNG